MSRLQKNKASPLFSSWFYGVFLLLLVGCFAQSDTTPHHIQPHDVDAPAGNLLFSWGGGSGVDLKGAGYTMGIYSTRCPEPPFVIQPLPTRSIKWCEVWRGSGNGCISTSTRTWTLEDGFFFFGGGEWEKSYKRPVILYCLRHQWI